MFDFVSKFDSPLALYISRRLHISELRIQPVVRVLHLLLHVLQLFLQLIELSLGVLVDRILIIFVILFQLVKS